jgi:GNAT superfamily N-acetyltransferase
VAPQALVVSVVDAAEAPGHAVLADLRAQAAAWLRDRRGGSDLLADLSSEAHPKGTEDIDLVAHLGSSPAGFLTATCTPATRRARVEGFFVRPELRGIGIGHELFEALLGALPGLGCDHVDAVALPGDRATKNFFEAHGLVTRALVVSTRSGDDGRRS